MIRPLIFIALLVSGSQAVILPFFSWHLNFWLWPAAVFPLLFWRAGLLKTWTILAVLTWWFDWWSGATPGLFFVSFWLVLILVKLLQGRLWLSDLHWFWAALLAPFFYFIFGSVFFLFQRLINFLFPVLAEPVAWLTAAGGFKEASGVMAWALLVIFLINFFIPNQSVKRV